MHDIDSTATELVDELLQDNESLDPEGLDELVGGPTDSEVDMAAELLEVSSDAELEFFLGKLMRGASQLMRSPAGQLLKGALRNVAKKALPIAGAALGNMVAPGLGGAIGGKLASSLGSAIGLEAEGLNEEEQQMELAKRVISTARQALTQVARDPRVVTDPRSAVRDAVANAVGRNLPGLLRPVLGGRVVQAMRGNASGRWVRRGNRIVLYGV
jgi:hypothetical protein